MKKVIALALAVLMLSVVALAVPKTEITNSSRLGDFTSNVAPNGSIKIWRNEVSGGGSEITVTGTATASPKYVIDSVGGKALTAVENEDGALGETLNDLIFRSIDTDNYSISNVKVTTGKSLVAGVSINDKEGRVQVNFVDDLNNTTAKNFDVSFTLKGKGKFQLGVADTAIYEELTGTEKTYGTRVTLPNLKFTVSGKVGYGKVEVCLGSDTDEDLEDLTTLKTTDGVAIDLDKDIIKFTYDDEDYIGSGIRIARAGSYTADAILTQPYGEAMTMEARVYSSDVIFFGVSNDPDTALVNSLADSDADMDFYFFNTDKNFTTFNSNVKLYFNEAEEEDYVYQVVNGKLVLVGAWDEDEGCQVVRTRTLGQYVVSDVELSQYEASAGDLVDSVNGNPDTGANDVVGIAAALAAVALVSAAAVSLKK